MSRIQIIQTGINPARYQVSLAAQYPGKLPIRARLVLDLRRLTCCLSAIGQKLKALEIDREQFVGKDWNLYPSSIDDVATFLVEADDLSDVPFDKA